MGSTDGRTSCGSQRQRSAAAAVGAQGGPSSKLYIYIYIYIYISPFIVQACRSFWAESAKTLGFGKRELLAKDLGKGLYKGICFQIWTPDLEDYGRLARWGEGGRDPPFTF